MYIRKRILFLLPIIFSLSILSNDIEEIIIKGEYREKSISDEDSSSFESGSIEISDNSSIYTTINVSIDNNSFFAKIDLNTSKIMKVRIAEIFYQQTHSDQIFDFDPSANTLFGYNMGLELSDNMVFILKGRKTYQINEENKFEPIKTTQFETQIIF